MARTKKSLAIIIPLWFLALIISPAQERSSFSQFVDGEGKIIPPSDFRASWVHLGTWVVTSQTATGPDRISTSHANGIHGAYTRREFLKAFKQTGKWPDGAVLVLEVRPVQWDDLPTGHVMYSGDTTEIAVMVKDGSSRFKDNPNWGAGWGWALFKPSDPGKNMSLDSKNDCLSCHEVARGSDFVFVQGYPVLR